MTELFALVFNPPLTLMVGGAPTFPLVAPLSFTLSRRVMNLCIMERGAPAPASVTVLASRRPHRLIG